MGGGKGSGIVEALARLIGMRKKTKAAPQKKAKATLKAGKAKATLRKARWKRAARKRKAHYAQESPKPAPSVVAIGGARYKPALPKAGIQTDFDRVLEFAKEKGNPTKGQIAKSLRMNPKRVQECCDVLEQSGLVKIKYAGLGPERVIAAKPEGNGSGGG